MIITDDLVERAAYVLEKHIKQSQYRWSNTTFDVWWFDDPHFIEKITSWGDDFGRGTRKERCLWEARILLEAAVEYDNDIGTT